MKPHCSQTITSLVRVCDLRSLQWYCTPLVRVCEVRLLLQWYCTPLVRVCEVRLLLQWYCTPLVRVCEVRLLLQWYCTPLVRVCEVMLLLNLVVHCQTNRLGKFIDVYKFYCTQSLFSFTSRCKQKLMEVTHCLIYDSCPWAA